MNDDDASLLRQFAQEGTESAFAELVRRHLDLVHSAALRQVAGDSHRAQDVTQTVFAELARQAKRLGGHRSLAGWLYTTARFVAARAQRSEQRRLARERAAHAMNEAETSAAGPAWDELKPLLDEAMHRLTAADREAVVLRFFQDRPLAAVGGALGVSENAARMRVDRALDKLRAELARRGIASTAAALTAVLSAHAATPAPAGLAATVATAASAVPVAASWWAAGSLAETIVLFMTAKKWLALGALLIAGAVVVPRLRTTPSLPPPPTLEVRFAAPAPVVAATNPDLAAGFRWKAIEADDYRQFIANLRASGAPERLIRDVVALELYRLYAPRFRAAQSRGPERAYWQKPATRATDQEQADQRRSAEMNREMRAVLLSLFGPTCGANDAVNVLHDQPDFDAIQLAWLPPEVETRAGAALEPILDAERSEQRSSETWAIQQIRLERRLDALRDLLTPAQLEEYRWRNNPRTQHNRTVVRYWDPTEAEFRKLIEHEDHLLYSPATQMDDLRTREEKARRLLGPERAPDFIKATDLSYSYARELMQQGELPPDTADRVWQLKRETLADDERLRLATALSPEERRQQRAALTARARDGLTALVGAKGLRRLQQDWPWWKALEKP